MPLLLTDFIHCSGVSIGDFEQINGQWFKSILLKLNFILIFYYIAIQMLLKSFCLEVYWHVFLSHNLICCFSKLLCTIFVSMFMLTEFWFICTFLKKWYKIEKKEEKKRSSNRMDLLTTYLAIWYQYISFKMICLACSRNRFQIFLGNFKNFKNCCFLKTLFISTITVSLESINQSNRIFIHYKIAIKPYSANIEGHQNF